MHSCLVFPAPLTEKTIFSPLYILAYIVKDKGLLGVITQPTKERDTLGRKIVAALNALQATAIIHGMLQNSLCLVICITSYL